MQYRRLAEGIDLEPDVRAGHTRAAAFLDPILQGIVAENAIWNPVDWTWRAAKGS